MPKVSKIETTKARKAKDEMRKTDDSSQKARAKSTYGAQRHNLGDAHDFVNFFFHANTMEQREG